MDVSNICCLDVPPSLHALHCCRAKARGRVLCCAVLFHCADILRSSDVRTHPTHWSQYEGIIQIHC
jgi:hypothetical protein